MINIINIGKKNGLGDWVLQRFSGFILFVYCIFLFIYIIFHGFTYESWSYLFSSFYFKLFTILSSFFLYIHTSIGVWTVVTDYIKNVFLRVFFELFFNILLLFYIFFIVQILWGF